MNLRRLPGFSGGALLSPGSVTAYPGLLGLLLTLQVAPNTASSAQPLRAALEIKWTADSSWEGRYYEKLHRFHVHEELAGRLVFDLSDTSLLPRKQGVVGAAGLRAVRAIQLREDGAGSGAVLVEAIGSSAYTADVQKEGGDCTETGEGAGARIVDPPFIGREEAEGSWEARAPGPLLIVFRGAEPVGIAFSPKSMRVRSTHRLLCPKPESVTRWQVYRITARSGELVQRPKADTTADAGGKWIVETRRTPRDGYTGTARYSFVVRQQHAVAGDSSAATGRLEVTKTLVFTWERLGG